MNDETMLAELRTLAPAPKPAPLPAHGRARLATALDTVMISTPGSRRRSLQAFIPAALLAACVCTVSALIALAFLNPSPRGLAATLPVRAEPDAVRALDGLATVALTTSTPTVGADEFVYVRSTVITNNGMLGGPVGLGAAHEREIWLSQRPSTDEQGLIREFGQDWPISGGRPVTAGPERPTYEWIQGLPTDPDRVITDLASHQPSDSEQSPEQYVFERIGDLITESLVPPELAGALFEAVTKLPGVRLVDHAEDAIGREGFGISRTDERYGITTVWVFQPGSPAPLGVRWYFDGPASEPGARTLFGATAVLERGVAEQLGASPGQHPPDRA